MLPSTDLAESTSEKAQTHKPNTVKAYSLQFSSTYNRNSSQALLIFTSINTRQLKPINVKFTSDVMLPKQEVHAYAWTLFYSNKVPFPIIVSTNDPPNVSTQCNSIQPNPTQSRDIAFCRFLTQHGAAKCVWSEWTVNDTKNSQSAHILKKYSYRVKQLFESIYKQQHLLFGFRLFIELPKLCLIS